MARIECTVKPGSSKPGFSRENGLLVLRVRERAIEGAANAACVSALSGALNVAPSRIVLIRGHRARRKLFEIAGLTEEDVESAIG